MQHSFNVNIIFKRLASCTAGVLNTDWLQLFTVTSLSPAGESGPVQPVNQRFTLRSASGPGELPSSSDGSASAARSSLLLCRLLQLPLPPLQDLHPLGLVPRSLLGPEILHVLEEPVPVQESSEQSDHQSPEQNRFGETFRGGQLVRLHCRSGSICQR